MEAIENVEQSLASLRALLLKGPAERDAFSSFLGRSRLDYDVILEHEGERGARFGRFLKRNYREARELGYEGSEGAWKQLLSLRPEQLGDGEPMTGNAVALWAEEQGLGAFPLRQAA